MIINLTSKRIKSIDDYYHHQYQQYLNHTQTKALDLSNNELVNNDGLKDFKNLYYLDLSFNRICLLLPFSQSIVRLNLSHNHIGAALEDYQKLLCQQNPRQIQSPFYSLINLQDIDLSYNEINSLHSSLFENNKKLSCIILHHNNIKGPLYSFIGLNLQLLDLGHNNLQINNVEKLDCIKIRILVLQFNPLEQYPNYDIKLRLSLKCVEQIQFACQLLVIDQQLNDLQIQRNSSIKTQSASSVKKVKENLDPKTINKRKSQQILQTPPKKCPRPNQIKQSNLSQHNSDTKQISNLNSSSKKKQTVKRTMSHPKINLQATNQKIQVEALQQYHTSQSQEEQLTTENKPLITPQTLDYTNDEIDSIIFKVNIDQKELDQQNETKYEYRDDLIEDSQRLDVLTNQYDDCNNQIKCRFAQLAKIENDLYEEQRFINILKTIIIQRYQGGQCTQEFQQQLDQVEQILKDRNPNYKELHQRLLPTLFVTFNKNEIKTII